MKLVIYLLDGSVLSIENLAVSNLQAAQGLAIDVFHAQCQAADDPDQGRRMLPAGEPAQHLGFPAHQQARERGQERAAVAAVILDHSSAATNGRPIDVRFEQAFAALEQLFV